MRQSLQRALSAPAKVLASAGAREAAVAVVVTDDRRLWLVERALHPNDPWSGDLAFPGGKRADGDADLRATAMREAGEEVGVVLSGADCLGQLDDLEARPVRSMRVRPYVFWLASVPVWRLNAEIACMVPVSLDALCAGGGRTTFRWPHAVLGVELPCIMIGKRRLWGLTLRMVDDLSRRLHEDGLCSDPLHRP